METVTEIDEMFRLFSITYFTMWKRCFGSDIYL